MNTAVDSATDGDANKAGAAKGKEVRRRQRRTVRLTLQFFPMAIGLIGIFLISSWSLQMRMNQPDLDAIAYYFGMALVLLALQLPMLLEINRRRTRRFMKSRVLMVVALVVSALMVVAYNLAPKVDYDKVLEQELSLFDDMYD